MRPRPLGMAVGAVFGDPPAIVMRALVIAVLVVGSPACVTDNQAGVPATDPVMFRTKVYPVLLGSCAFPACHGDPKRFFTVYGPGRTRLKPTTAAYAPATPDELALTYTRAQSMLVSPDGVRQSLLLRKPLSIGAGGAGHKGDDPWGFSVIPDTADPRYAALLAWATSKGAP